MRINIVLDDDLVQEAFKSSGAKTKKELIHLALKEFVEKKKEELSRKPAEPAAKEE